MRSWILLLLASLNAGWVGRLSAQETRDPPPSPKPPAPTALDNATPEQIRGWITDLGARRFDDRDHATQSLIAVGTRVIPYVLEAAYNQDREAALRSIVIIQEIGARGDNDALQSALTALDKISQNVSALVVAHQATEAKNTLGEVRQQRTVEYLTKLGAVVTPQLEDGGLLNLRIPLDEPVYAIEIGNEWHGTEKDLERLRWIKDAQQVNFTGPQVKDSWFQFLQGMPRLFSVKVKHADISKTAIDTLSQTEGLGVLRLLYVPLDDAEVLGLENCKSLQYLVVISKELTDDGVGALQRRFTKEKAKFPRGALMGIKAPSNIINSWTISEVLEGSAADKAGIRPLDRIVKYDGHEITDFDSLRELIDKTYAGDTVTVEIERGMEMLETKVTLGEWE